ncbi:MAG TPA: 50S ribosomal protein L29 [Planctomycetota bacterium]|nr:50S ribosomal protein L29 [Planctomycetota bacterium]
MKRSAQMKELREKQDTELRFDVVQKQKELFDLRFKSSSEGLANPSRISALRREIARLKTMLHDRELRASAAANRT